MRETAIRMQKIVLYVDYDQGGAINLRSFYHRYHLAPPCIGVADRGVSFGVTLIEGQHGAGDLAGLHRAEGFVDVAEPAAFGDHRVEVEPALAEEIEIDRDVGAEAVRAHPRGLHLALRANCHPWKFDHRIRRQYPHNCRCAADGQRLDRLAHQLGIADGLEGVIDTKPAGLFAYRLNRIGLARIDKMRGTHAHR